MPPAGLPAQHRDPSTGESEGKHLPGCLQNGIPGEVSPRGGSGTEQDSQGRGHRTKAERVQEAFGRHSQAHGVTLGVS